MLMSIGVDEDSLFDFGETGDTFIEHDIKIMIVKYQGC